VSRSASSPLESRPRSVRVELARLAAGVLAGTPGTALTAGAGARWSTADGDRVIRGVVAAAAPGGRVELELHLIVDWPPGPLGPLADAVRGRVSAAAELMGLQGSLGAIQIRIEDVREPGEARTPERPVAQASTPERPPTARGAR